MTLFSVMEMGSSVSSCSDLLRSRLSGVNKVAERDDVDREDEEDDAGVNGEEEEEEVEARLSLLR